YMRNGNQLYRLRTGIEFDEKLFPDMGHTSLTGQLWARKDWNGFKGLISDNEYKSIVADEERRLADLPKEDHWYVSRESREYQPFLKSNVFYDDIARFVQSEIDKHNRLVLILQGLLDRSPIFNPHPPWSLWNNDSFGQAIHLIYDESRALTAGEKPDF